MPEHETMSSPIWLFDLDNTLHDASRAVFGRLNGSMTAYIVEHLGLSHDEADALRRHYWQRYGATLLGLERHHGVRASHFLAQTHALPGLEAELSLPHVDRLALGRLKGRKFILTNAPAHYAARVLRQLGLHRHFEAVISIEGMRAFGHLRPKPDTRMLRVVLASAGLKASRCILVDDSKDNLRAAAALGMGAVWMQRYLRAHARTPARPNQAPLEAFAVQAGRPTWLRARVAHLRALQDIGARHARGASHDQ